MGFYSVGKEIEKAHLNSLAIHLVGHLDSWPSREMSHKMPPDTYSLASNICSSHDLSRVVHSQANREMPWYSQFFTKFDIELMPKQNIIENYNFTILIINNRNPLKVVYKKFTCQVNVLV